VLTIVWLCLFFIPTDSRFKSSTVDFETRKSDLWEGSQIKAFICVRSLIFASNSPIFMFQNRGCYTKEIKNSDWTFTSLPQLKLNPNLTCSTNAARVTGPLCFDEGQLVSILHPYWMDRPVYLPARPPAGRRAEVCFFHPTVQSSWPR